MASILSTYQPKAASRKQLAFLDKLMQSRAHTPEQLADYRDWLRNSPTAEQAHRRIDEAQARANDPEHREKADLCDRIDRATACVETAIDKATRPSGIIDHQALAQQIASQAQQKRQEAAQTADEAVVERDPQPTPETLDDMAAVYEARLSWEAEALCDRVGVPDGPDAPPVNPNPQGPSQGEADQLLVEQALAAPTVPGIDAMFPE